MYRDDLEAAMERADDLERELERARKELSADHERLAALEKQLHDALAEVKKSKHAAEQAGKQPASNSAGGPDARRKLGVAIGAIVALMLIGAGASFIVLTGEKKQSPPAGAARPTAAPAAPPQAAPVHSEPGKLADVTHDLSIAFTMAHEKFPDPELVSFSADYVDEQGLAHLEYGGEVRYRFRSPSRAAAPEPPSNLPLGAPRTPTRPYCRLSVKTYSGRPLRIAEGANGEINCGESVKSPSCSVAAVWALARKHGAPAGALAGIEYGWRGWQLQINDANRSVFSETIPDSCPTH